MASTKKQILITGATGYLGGHITGYFLSLGYKVIGLALSEKEIFAHAENPDAKLYYLNRTSLKTIFDENEIDIIIHTATLYGRSGESPSDMIKANVMFPVEVLHLAAEYNVELFINTDTILAENINPYAKTKSNFAGWLELYSDKLRCVNLRLDHFYGPNEKPIKFVAYLIEQLRNNTPEINLTEGSQNRDFIYIEDVLDAYGCVVSGMEKLENHKVTTFELGTNIKTSIKTLALMLKDMMKNNSTKLNFGAIPYRKYEVLDYEVDTAAIRLLGWTPRFGIEKGLEKILEIESKR